MSLTNLTLDNLVTKSKIYELFDIQGLSIMVYSTGRKCWMFRYTVDGLRKRITLGEYPAIGLTKARDLAEKYRSEAKEGRDPAIKHSEIKTARKRQPTFSELLQEYWDVYLSEQKAGTATRRLIEHDALPAWKNRKAESITRRDVVLLHDKVNARAPVTANRLIGALSKMFNSAIRRGVLEINPCLMVEKSNEKPRSRVLSDDEIRLLWAALEIGNKKIDLFRSTKQALKMILLSAQRPGEVCGIQWDELDNSNVWNIPGGRTKNGDSQQIPLTPLMIEVFDQARYLTAGQDFVFCSSHHEAALTTRALSRAVSRHWQEMGMEQAFTPHDIRRTVRTKLAEIGVDDHIAERIMGHRLQGMMRIYNQHSYLEEKRTALLRWESELRRITGEADTDKLAHNTKIIRVEFGKK